MYMIINTKYLGTYINIFINALCFLQKTETFEIRDETRRNQKKNRKKRSSIENQSACIKL